MHERAIKSKSDSNIKSARYRSTNHLLHSPSKFKQTNNSSSSSQSQSQKNKQKKKKPLSLQNSQDKSTLYAVQTTPGGTQVNVQQQPNQHSSTAASTRAPSRSYLNSFYDELRQKLFPLTNSNNQVGSISGVNTSSTTTNTANNNTTVVSSGASGGAGTSGGSGGSGSANGTNTSGNKSINLVGSGSVGNQSSDTSQPTVLSASNTVSTNVSASVTQPSQSDSVDACANETSASTEKILPI